MSINVCKTRSSPVGTAPVRLGIENLPALMAFERQANDDAWSEALLSAALVDDDFDVWGIWARYETEQGTLHEFVAQARSACHVSGKALAEGVMQAMLGV